MQNNERSDNKSAASAEAVGILVYLSTTPLPGTILNLKLGYDSGSGPGSGVQSTGLDLTQIDIRTAITHLPVTGVSLYDSSNVLIAQYNSITACTSPTPCWQVAQMMNGTTPTNYWVAWNPKAEAVVIMDNNITMVFT